jgi:hypothetical protein
MKKILAFTAILATCAQCMQADTTSTSTPPVSLEKALSGKRVSSDDAPKGWFMTFRRGGALKRERPGIPDLIGQWTVQGEDLCLISDQDTDCFDVLKLTEHELVLRQQSEDGEGRLMNMHFVNKQGVALRDVITFDGVLAKKLFGRVITVEDETPSPNLKGSKTVYEFETRSTVTVGFLSASGFPMPFGGELPYNSVGNDLCIENDQQKQVCMRVAISDDKVRLTPIENGALLEKEAMVGTFE